ncbi:MAG: hypothetical protein P3X24_000200, partial [bacterium]|nr:hypothetical protein [bacterium]
MFTQPIRAVGFDLDDTLCVYMPIAVQARLHILQTHLAARTQLPLDALDQHYRRAFRTVLEELHDPRWYPLYLQEGRATRTETFRRLLQSLQIDDERLADQ